MASIATTTTLSVASLLRTKSSALHPLLTSFCSLPRITCSLSSSSSTSPSSPIEFNISFGPSKPKLSPRGTEEEEDDTEESFGFIGGDGKQLFVPWIVRGEDGNLKLQSQPPARLIHALAAAKTQKPKKKDKPIKKADSRNAEPKLSKAARRFYNQNFKEPRQRLSKVLAAAGVSSRRGSEALIFERKVTVNGSVCDTPQTRVNPEIDIIYVNGNRLPKSLAPKVYLALNKPKGYICSSGEKEFKSILTLFDDYMKKWDKINPGTPKPRLFTVGRLDVGTTGLIIVTNDGDFAQKLSHPSSSLPKEYIATIKGDVNKRNLIAISEGTTVEGVHCTPDSVELLPRQPDLPRHRIRIVVHEGRNHEVREIVKNAGLEVHSLKRVRIGGFRLPPDLGIGMHVEMKQRDLKAVGWKS